MRKLLIFSFSLLAVILAFSNCEHKQPYETVGPVESGVESSGTINLKVSFAPRTGIVGKAAGIEAIDTVRAYVYDKTGSELHKEDLTLSDGRATGRLTVTALNDLKVVLAYYDGPIVQYLGTDDDVDVPHGGEAVADIVEYFMGVTIDAPDTVFVGEKYTVTWEEKPLAISYELQESARTAYQGIDTFTIIEAKAAESSYLYRVRVNTSYGYGPWYSLGSATTGVYVKEGGLDIDVPIPTDDLFEVTFVSIPGGSFEMGADDGTADQQPAHTVTISGFEISESEITNAQYAEFLNAALASGDITATTQKVEGAGGNYDGKEYINLSGSLNTLVKCFITYQDGIFSVENNKDYLPVIYVSWYGAKAFAEYYEYDLPTEAEWEYAARGGKQYKYGTNDGTLSASNANYYRTLSILVNVGSYPANPFGLYDMTGNVWEWCNDWYGGEYYSSSPANNPTGPTSGTYRINRGLDWYSRELAEQLVSYRKTDLPVAMTPYLGFRVVRR
ncbi:MAG: SUMF1/EgtB/PvdO family nonheme iron enzyme [Candidatus Latescibacteria bacterium]|nr:SUMF1/EgtB/PvdO family nonheme iron enzyme [Candidatus Latescibacterota bacterium]